MLAYHGGDRVRQDDCGIGERPAPVARVMAPAAQTQSASVKFTEPREPRNTVGRSALTRGPSEAIKHIRAKLLAQ